MQKWITAIGFGMLVPVLGEPLEVTDTKGRTVSIELLALEGEKAIFTVPGKGDSEYQLPLSQFDEGSQKKIKDAGASLPARVPKVEIDASISKRRKKISYYMVRQTVSAKITVQNPSRDLRFPGGKAKVIFIGRNSRDNSVYSVLRTQDFEVPKIESSREFTFETKSFSTEYDSDNDGYGNVGGFQYDSYIVGILGEQGRLLGFKTSDPSIRSAIGDSADLIKRVLEFNKGQRFDKNLEPLDGRN
ncbi:hypothetical protein [Haloferula sargassicola]|uniref:Uncharacterized protein n=1 Tax=Haloferula sargassicola TaxID=490096 RepID=A0ABP9UST5_9BACT